VDRTSADEYRADDGVSDGRQLPTSFNAQKKDEGGLYSFINIPGQHKTAGGHVSK